MTYDIRTIQRLLKLNNATNSCKSVAPGLKKNRMDDLWAIVPPIVKSYNLQHTNNCARFGLNILNYKHVMYICTHLRYIF